MDFDWQNIAAVGVVAGAAYYLSRTIFKSWTSRDKPGCGTCGSCPSNAEKDAAMIGGRPLVSLEIPRSSGDFDSKKK